MMTSLLPLKCRNCNSPYSHSLNDVRHVPLVLSCGCTFCMGCLSQLTRGDHIKCPQCRKQTFISADLNLRDQLPPNYYVLGLVVAKDLKLPRFLRGHPFKQVLATSASNADECVEITYHPPEVKESIIRCEECSCKASLSCLQCEGQYCSSCFHTIHMSSISMRRHKATPLSQLKRGPTHCPTHPALLLDYYCKDDSLCCCSECCITGGHKGHQIVSLLEIAKSQRQKLNPLITEAKNSIQVLKTASKEIEDSIGACRKDVRQELGNLEKRFVRCHTLLQLHHHRLAEQMCTTMLSSISPAQSILTEHQTQLQTLCAKVKLGLDVFDDDYHLMKACPSLIDELISSTQTPLLTASSNICPPKVQLDLTSFTKYLEDHLGTITNKDGALLNGLPNGNDVTLQISGSTSPALPVSTPTSSRPPSALSESYQSSVIVGSEKGSRASSYRSVSPSPSKRPSNVVEEVNYEDTIEVIVSHTVSPDEFYVQSQGQQLKVRQLSQSLSSQSPVSVRLTVDTVKEGMRCAAWSSTDSLWYRALVSSINMSSPPHASVKYIDCGRIEDVPITNLYELSPSLCRELSLCVQCHLHAVHPPKVRHQHQTTPTIWSSNANHIFAELVINKSFMMKVYRQRSSGVLSVDLLSFDGRGAGGEVMGECSSVINILIERGVAVRNSRKWEEPSSLSINLGSGDCLDVTVPMAENPWDFCVHLVSGEEDLQRISKVLSHHTKRLQCITFEPYRNMLCVCQYSEDGQWYRSQVKDVKNSSVLVNYVDYGNSETVTSDHLYQLPDEVLSIPFQAIHCCLQNIQPMAPLTKWPEDVANDFNRLVGEPLYNMVVKQMGTPLSVELVDKSTSKSLSDLLVERNVAEYAPKSSSLLTSFLDLVELSSSADTQSLPPSLPTHTISLSDVVAMSSFTHTPALKEAHSPSFTPTIPPLQLKETHSLSSMPTIPPPQLPSVGETLTAKVVHVVSLSHFYIQRPHPWLLSRLSHLKEVKWSNNKDLKPGAACVARFYGDEAYHRVSVLSLSNCEVKVCYVDFGNCLSVGIDDVFPLPSEFSDVPALAIPCSLVGGGSLMPMEVASENMLPLFSELIVDKNLSVTVKGVDSGPPAVLLVSLVDEEGADVEKKLVELIPTLSLSQSEEVERSDSGSAASQSHSTSVADSMTVCVTFVSEEGIVFGHDVSPGSSTADNLKFIENAIDDKCKTSPSPSPYIAKGDVVCARSSEDGIWYRASVLNLQNGQVVVHYIDYGNTEAVPMGDVITEAVLPSLSPQAVGIKFPCLSPPSVRAEQLISLSQLIVDQNIDLIIRGKTEDSYLIASSEVIDCWMAAENCTAL